MLPLNQQIEVESWPIDGSFTIARGSRREAVVVVVTLNDGVQSGRAEAVPYARYGENTDSVVAQIKSAAAITDRVSLSHALPAGAARNALDCAMWDLEAERSPQGTAQGDPDASYLTCFTLSLASPAGMAAKARAAAEMPLLKLKLGAPGDAERMRAVRSVRPDARIVVDANEGWTVDAMPALVQAAAEVGIELIEQPLPAGEEAALAGLPRLVPLCADESAHTTQDLRRLGGLYDGVNIKLDKAGGLTEAHAMAVAAKAQRLKIMVGCMVSTSLAMAPALLLAPFADWLDLDGPLLLARDREPAISYRRGRIFAAAPELWGPCSLPDRRDQLRTR